jgi:hypothetical protein
MYLQNLSQLSQEAVADFMKAVSAPDSNILAKAGIQQSTGLVAYDLQAPAKNLLPVLTPLRNKLPRVNGGGGTATNWKRVTAINTASLRGFVPEGGRNGVMTIASDDKSANYKTLGMEDSITYEAERAAKGFEDIRSTQAQRLLWATMLEEEYAILGGNYGVALGTPVAPTVTVTDGDGGSIAADPGGYACRVVALTLAGYLASSLANGVVQEVSVTPADGGTPFTYGGGSSQKSNATVSGAAGGGASTLKLSTTVVPGAVAYAWYVGAHDGDVKLEAITTVNHVKLLSLAGTHQNVTAITADFSKNLLGFDGILSTAWGSGSGAYIYNMATGTPGTGTGLTADNAGGITEVDALLESLWTNYKLGPTTIYCNSQEAKNITKKLLGATGVSYNINVQQGAGFSAGSLVTKYLNKFGMGGNTLIPIEVHPWMPAGTMIAVCEQLPYPINGVPNVMEMRLRQDYYQIEWPIRTRKYESGVYMDGVFAHYFPPSIGIITNIANA